MPTIIEIDPKTSGDGAAATVRFVLLDVIAKTALVTGLIASKPVDILLAALIEAVSKPATAWAFRDLANGKPDAIK